MDTTLPVEPRPHANYRIPFLIAGIIILIGLAALAAYFFTGGEKTFSLQGVRYLAGSFESRTLRELTLTGSKDVVLPVEGRVVDYARAGEHEAAIMLTQDESQIVYVLGGEQPRAVARGLQIRGGLSISPDGQTIAFSERKADAPLSTRPTEFYDHSLWTVRVINLTDGSETQMGEGYGTALFVHEGALHLAYGAPEGIHIANLATGKQDTVPYGWDGFSQAFTIFASEDGNHLLIPTISGEYALYTLTYTESGYVLTGTEVQPVGAEAAAFKGERIVVLKAVEGSSAFGAASIDDPAAVSLREKTTYELVTKIIP